MLVSLQRHTIYVFKKHGMAKSRQDGKVVYYSLANEDILSAIHCFLKLSENLSMKS